MPFLAPLYGLQSLFSRRLGKEAAHSLKRSLGPLAAQQTPFLRNEKWKQTYAETRFKGAVSRCWTAGPGRRVGPQTQFAPGLCVHAQAAPAPPVKAVGETINEDMNCGHGGETRLCQSGC